MKTDRQVIHENTPLGVYFELFQQTCFFKCFIDLGLVEAYYVFFTDLDDRDSHLPCFFNKLHCRCLVSCNGLDLILNIQRRKILFRLIAPRSGVGRIYFYFHHDHSLLLVWAGNVPAVNYNANFRFYFLTKDIFSSFDDFADNINNKDLLLSFSFGIIFLSSLVPLSLFFFFGWFGFVPFYMLQLFTN